MTLVDTVAAVLLLGGAGLILLASIGLQRFEDVFARIHPATKATSLGIVLVLLGAAVRVAGTAATLKLLLAVALQLLTAPIAAHMVGRAAYSAGTELGPGAAVDELAGVDLDAGVDDVAS